MHDRIGEQSAVYSVVLPVAQSGKPVTAARKRSTARAVKAVQTLVDRFSPKDVDVFAARIEEALNSTSPSSPQAALAFDLTNGHTYSHGEQTALEVETLVRSFRLREALLEGALTAPQVASVLGTSRQTPHDRVKAGSLLAIVDNGMLRFPPWQFDPEGSDRVVAGLSEVLRALPSDMSVLAKANWFVRPNPYLEGRSPLTALKGGDVERVIDEARALGPT